MLHDSDELPSSGRVLVPISSTRRCSSVTGCRDLIRTEPRTVVAKFWQVGIEPQLSEARLVCDRNITRLGKSSSTLTACLLALVIPGNHMLRLVGRSGPEIARGYFDNA